MRFAGTEGTGMTADGPMATPKPHASARGVRGLRGAFRFPLGLSGMTRRETDETAKGCGK